MFDFAYPHLLWLLWTLGVFGMLFWWSRLSRARKLRRFGNPAVIGPLMPDTSKYKPGIKIVLELIALASLVIVLARPRAGETEQNSEVRGIEVMIAFDISNSMLASGNDDPNGISRLDRAKLVLEKLVDKLENDKVGMVIFAGQAKMQLPITVDYSSAKMYINDLTPDLIAYQGTDISTALEMAMRGFSPAEDVSKAIILITDAENHDGDAVEVARMAAEKGIQVDVISMGGAKGVPIPVNSSKSDFLRDNEGQIVLTSTNQKLAADIAKAGNGICINGASSSALDNLTSHLGGLDGTLMKNVKYSAGAEQFPTFAWIALLFLIIDIFVLDRKIGWLNKINFFTK